MGLLLAGWAWPVTKDLFDCQWPVAQHPANTVVPQFAGQFGWRDGQDRALGVAQAVPGHFGRWHPAHGAVAASAHEQHIRRMAGQADQHPPGRAPLYAGLHHRVVGDLPHTATSASLSRWQARFRTASRNGPDGVIRSARSPPGGSHAMTGIKTAWCARARNSP